MAYLSQQLSTLLFLVAMDCLRGSDRQIIIDPCRAGGYQGDMAYIGTSLRDHPARVRRAATSDKQRLWPNGIIPFEISNQFVASEKAVILKAMQTWQINTCIVFLRRTTQDEFVYFQKKGDCGCCSFVGRMGNGHAQGLNLATNCVKIGTVLHEIGHAIGFWHEHTRPDRDRYVTIDYKNIKPGEAKNFRRLTIKEIDSLGVAYDYQSIMHYSKNTFSLSGFESTIIPVNNSGLFIGQRDHLSPKDIQQTKKLYGCPSCGRTLSSSRGRVSFLSSSGPSKGSRTCLWRITCSPHEKVKVTFNYTYFYFPCKTVSMEIYNGDMKSQARVYRYCRGKKAPEMLMLEGPSVWLKFNYGYKYFNLKPIGFKAKYEVICDGDIKAGKGEIRSPGYPNRYKDDVICTWTIKAAKGKQILLHFEVFGLQTSRNCDSDYLEVKETRLNGNRINKFCSNKVPKDILSNGNELHLKFKTNFRDNGIGFVIQYSTGASNPCEINNGNCSHICHPTNSKKDKTIECSCYRGYRLQSNGYDCMNDCGGTTETPFGSFTSPGFPRDYAPNQKCTWDIKGLKGNIIVLTFVDFLLEQAQVIIDDQGKGSSQYKRGTFICAGRYDNVLVIDSGKRDPLRLCGEMGQRKIIVSTSNRLRIIFHSDRTISGRGFKAHFKQVKDVCALNNGGCEHECHIENEAAVCKCQNGYELSTDKKSCVRAGCDLNVYSNHGWLSSNQDTVKCTWIFNTTQGQIYEIRMQSLSISGFQTAPSCDEHALRFYSFDRDWTEMYQFCGIGLLPTLKTPNHHLKVVSHHAPGEQSFRFNLTYASKCGGKLYARKHPQDLYSHAMYGKENYPESQECTWLIRSRQSNKRHRIQLKVIRFEMEGGRLCQYDYLDIYDGDSTKSPLLKKLCGDKLTETSFVSSGKSILLKLKTDNSVGRAGIWIQYSRLKPRQKRGYLQLYDPKYELKN